jgi:hypothetical protein
MPDTRSTVWGLALTYGDDQTGGKICAMKKLIRKITRWAWKSELDQADARASFFFKEAKRVEALADRYHKALYSIGHLKCKLPIQVAREAMNIPPELKRKN